MGADATPETVRLDAVYRRAADIIDRKIAGEALLVPIRGRLADLQRLFALNPVAEYIWQQVDGQRPLADIHDGVVRRFDVAADTAQADLETFIQELIQAGLIERI